MSVCVALLFVEVLRLADPPSRDPIDCVFIKETGKKRLMPNFGRRAIIVILLGLFELEE
jgi:hypothetical protein